MINLVIVLISTVVCFMITIFNVFYIKKNIGSKKVKPETSTDAFENESTSPQVRPFEFINRTDPAHVLNFIQQEHPQIIALILSYLEPVKASILLQNLPNE